MPSPRLHAPKARLGCHSAHPCELMRAHVRPCAPMHGLMPRAMLCAIASHVLLPCALCAACLRHCAHPPVHPAATYALHRMPPALCASPCASCCRACPVPHASGTVRILLPCAPCAACLQHCAHPAATRVLCCMPPALCASLCASYCRTPSTCRAHPAAWCALTWRQCAAHTHPSAGPSMVPRAASWHPSAGANAWPGHTGTRPYLFLAELRQASALLGLAR